MVFKINNHIISKSNIQRCYYSDKNEINKTGNLCFSFIKIIQIANAKLRNLLLIIFFIISFTNYSLAYSSNTEINIDLVDLSDINQQEFKSYMSNHSTDPKYQFKIWHGYHKKEYTKDSLEYIKREQIFLDNWNYVNQYQLNKNGNSNEDKKTDNTNYINNINSANIKIKEKDILRLSLNSPFADLSFDEFILQFSIADNRFKKEKEFLLNNNNHTSDSGDDDRNFLSKSKSSKYKSFTEDTNPKTSKDWSDSFPFAPRNQKNCNSCYAFAALGLLEAYDKMNNINKIPSYLSVQEIVDCDSGSHGCVGGYVSSTLSFLLKYGVELDYTYKYKNKDLQCKYREKIPFILNTYKIDSFDYCFLGIQGKECNDDILDDYISQSPYASFIPITKELQLYESGIMETNCENITYNHAIIVVQKTPEYFKIRNSWGNEWGENGYFRIKNYNGGNNGSCSLEKYALVINRK